MNVLIIGLGSIGKRHLQNIIDHKKEWGIDGILVHDSNPEAWHGLEEMGIRGECAFLTGHGSLLSEPFDAAIICTPPRFHYPYTILTRNAHVLVEKPLTYNLPWEDEYNEDGDGGEHGKER